MIYYIITGIVFALVIYTMYIIWTMIKEDLGIK